MQKAGYGAWTSPITGEKVASSARGLSQVKTNTDGLYWVEQRPKEKGRRVLMHRNVCGEIRCLTPSGFSVRTRVHEYGGGDYCVDDHNVYFSNDVDQRWYRQALPNGMPYPITPPSSQPMKVRYADACVTPNGRWLIAVREQHQGAHGIINDLVAIDTQGVSEPRCLFSGNDFYAFPCVSPDGRSLAWISWDHPQMPWDGTMLWVAELTDDARLKQPRWVAGHASESIYQPAWSPSGVLHCVSDRSGWWNVYRVIENRLQPVFEMEADAGYPLWVFGTNTYAFLSEHELAVIFQKKGRWELGVVREGVLKHCPLAFDDMEPTLALQGDNIILIAANAVESPQVLEYDHQTQQFETVYRSAAVSGKDYFSKPLLIQFPTECSREAYGFFYPPCNPGFFAPEGEKPPLLMITHGGPTSSARTALNLKTQYWTSRGFAVMDVNYSGSTGYGRAYRDRLKKRWGEIDVLDCVNAAAFLVSSGRVDPKRLVIRGGSAGGYTTLCALTFYDVFAAGGSYYGVADLEGLVDDTHKFEARYLESLVGTYPAEKEKYRARSPVRHADQLTCPVIFLQGLEDKVVPPAQAESMMRALDKKQVPYTYVTFENEQHGFRDAENIQHALASELAFYKEVLGLE